MSLLQIAEPGMSTAPHQERFAVGIDLGTTNSLAATVRNGSPEVLVDENNQKLLPSVVHYQKDGGVVVGEEARLRAEADPLNTISSVKRFMGGALPNSRTAVTCLMTLSKARAWSNSTLLKVPRARWKCLQKFLKFLKNVQRTP